MFLHIDIDSFFASAERSVNAKLKGIPICVGSRSNLEIFNKKRTNIKLMNENSGAFVTPVFYSAKKKTFDIGKHFNYNIVIEGVETKVQKDTLLKIGHKLSYQGYYLSRPLSRNQFREKFLI